MMTRVGEEPQHCRSCGHPIVWLGTRAGKAMPVDAETVQPGDDRLDLTRHRSHFASCPQAARWRKR